MWFSWSSYYAFLPFSLFSHRGNNAADIVRNLSLTWDGAYRLTNIANTGTVAETYGYDAFDRRIWISDGVETNHLVYPGPHVVAETDSVGTITRSYSYGPGIDNILSMTVHDGTNTTTFWYVTDHLNTVWALVDESGTVVESYDYDAYGNVKVFDDAGSPISESAVGNRFLFQGREFSFATGLYHFRARYYDPETGRWLSKDPIGITGGLNLYTYCAANPVNNIDPDGLTSYRNYLSAFMPEMDQSAQYWMIGVSTPELSQNSTRDIAVVTGAGGLAIGGGVASFKAGMGVYSASLIYGPRLAAAGAGLYAGGRNAYYRFWASSPGTIILEYPQRASRTYGEWLAPVIAKVYTASSRVGSRPPLSELYEVLRSFFSGQDGASPTLYDDQPNISACD